LSSSSPGLIWLTRPDTRALATSAEPLTYFLNLKLADPAQADAFTSRYDALTSNPDSAGPFLDTWQDIGRQDATIVTNGQRVMLVAS